MRNFIVLLAITAVCSCGQPAQKKSEEAKLFDNNTELKTFPVQGGWGYSIDVNGQKFIRQETIPAIQGTHAFKRKEDAEKVGAWVEAHIRHNEEFSLTLPVVQSLIGQVSSK